VEVIETDPIPELPEGSFRLVSGPLLWDSGLLMQYGADQVRRLSPEPFVALNPAHAAKAGLSEGYKVTVSSEHGTVSLIVKTDGTVQAGAAWVPARLAGAPAEVLGAGLGEPIVVTIQPALSNPEHEAPGMQLSATTPASQAVQD
jgi:anaerobic selenocysteine-containing dehydrogenase